MRSRDDAQMMLLTAVILLIGFVALAGMVARVSQLPDETVRESRDPILAQIENVEVGMRLVLAEAEAVHPLALPSTDHQAFLQSANAYFGQILTARGYVSIFGDPTCTDVGGHAVVSQSVQMNRAGVTAAFTVTATHDGKGPACF